MNKEKDTKAHGRKKFLCIDLLALLQKGFK